MKKSSRIDKNYSSSNKKILSIFSLLVLVILFFGILINRRVNRVPELGIFPGAEALSQGKVILDYSTQTSTGSPLVFGGAGVPGLDHQIGWNLIADSGMTMMRKEIRIESELPAGTTLESYKDNVNNVQDTATWNQTQIKLTNDYYKNMRNRNMKVMSIMDYAPGWLTYNGKFNGIPKDWDVYEDIVKKSYKLHREYIDMIEIWNEPDAIEFFDVTGSGLTPNQAYGAIFYHATKAIRAADAEAGDGRRVTILGTAASDSTNARQLDYILSQPYGSNLDAVSYHSYGKVEPSWTAFKNVLIKHGKANMPIYVTEWNVTADYIQNNQFTSGNIAVPYTAKKLIRFLKGGIAGANFFSSTYFVATNPNRYMNSFGYYTIKTGQYSLLPMSRTWFLMSKSLGLGAGASSIHRTQQQDLVEAMAFTNARSQKGFIIVNEGVNDLVLDLSLKNLNVPSGIMANVYISSDLGDGKGLYCSRSFSGGLTTPTFLIMVPWRSAVGVTFTDPRLASHSSLDRVLAYTTSKYCFTGLE